MIQLVSKVSLSNKDAVPPLPLVTLEDHFLAPSFEDNPEIARLYNFFPSRTKDSLRDLSDARLANMDEGGVAVQVVSHGPGAGNADQCRAANDHLAAAIAKHPERLRGFATLSMGDADAAAKEFARCVRELGFVGALIENNTGGRHYDHEQFWPVFAMAQELDVPIYIHPAFPEGDFAEHLKGEYADVIAMALGAFGWGWHADTGLHVLKLYAAGLFDRFPKLKIVIGHMGEFIPFQLSRILRTDSRGMSGERTRNSSRFGMRTSGSQRAACLIWRLCRVC